MVQSEQFEQLKQLLAQSSRHDTALKNVQAILQLVHREQNEIHLDAGAGPSTPPAAPRPASADFTDAPSPTSHKISTPIDAMSPGGRHYEAWWPSGQGEPDPLAKKILPTITSKTATYSALRGVPAYVHPASAKIDSMANQLAEIRDLVGKLSLSVQSTVPDNSTQPIADDEFQAAFASVGRVTVSLLPNLGSFPNLERFASWYVNPLPLTVNNPRGQSPQQLESSGVGHEWRGGSKTTPRWSEFAIIIRAILFAASGGDPFASGPTVGATAGDHAGSVDPGLFVAAAKRLDEVFSNQLKTPSVPYLMRCFRPRFGLKRERQA